MQYFVIQKRIQMFGSISAEHFIRQPAHQIFLKGVHFSRLAAVQIVRSVKLEISEAASQNFIFPARSSRVHGVMEQLVDDRLFAERARTDDKSFILQVIICGVHALDRVQDNLEALKRNIPFFFTKRKNIRDPVQIRLAAPVLPRCPGGFPLQIAAKAAALQHFFERCRELRNPVPERRVSFRVRDIFSRKYAALICVKIRKASARGIRIEGRGFQQGGARPVGIGFAGILPDLRKEGVRPAVRRDKAPQPVHRKRVALNGVKVISVLQQGKINGGNRRAAGKRAGFTVHALPPFLFMVQLLGLIDRLAGEV
ncbi:MAG TPA: hypothetical protein IAB55_03490 [Candidatus Merdivicinus faecavium]|nr:hypothetical protein [Candidatus Merdivicinus faecavium]